MVNLISFFFFKMNNKIFGNGNLKWIKILLRNFGKSRVSLISDMELMSLILFI